ncbi:MAG: GtrA family protein [Gammaproteobacteria bacterium]
MNLISHRFAYYLVGGCFNTAVTYAIYFSLLHFFPYYTAYTITYIVGILISYYINSVFVFNNSLSLKKMMQFPSVYLVQYFLGVASLYIFVDQMRINANAALLLVIIISVPITYLLSGYILKEYK